MCLDRGIVGLLEGGGRGLLDDGTIRGLVGGGIIGFKGTLLFVVF